MSEAECPTGGARGLRTRYTVADLDALSAEEARRFVVGGVGLCDGLIFENSILFDLVVF